MKKYISISFIAVLFVFISNLTVFPKTGDSKIIRCRIININTETIEVKKGRTEHTFYLTEDTNYIAKDGSEADRSIIEICQYVSVYYKTEGQKKILNKIVIIKESDCIKK
ncbi:MAG: hypothetical protein JW864_00400 [Spirochaetes bacterium]|nr:hypothetical protein [Spirochaetota bacterium]